MQIVQLSKLTCVPILFVLASHAAAGGTPYLGPSQYLAAADSPFYERAGYFEDFEDGELNTLGVTFNAGRVVGPGFNVDSVDGDDGFIDGNGNDGHSWFVVGSAGLLTVTFDAELLEGLPTWAGIVWTDGRNEVMFEAFDANGESLGVVSSATSDGDSFGGTAEDRFFGLDWEAGISGFNLWNTAELPMEVDHLWYGTEIPAPGTASVLSVIALAAVSRRRRH
jgi:uncharacterized protein (TIGR03382 family)